LLGEPFGAREALDAGIVSHVVADGTLSAELETVVAKLLAKPAEAMRLTQRLLRRGTRDEMLERMALENGHFSERLQSDEVRAAITAFFARKSNGA
jgi:enoyl-CoA hydratase/carnithine racemase